MDEFTLMSIDKFERAEKYWFDKFWGELTPVKLLTDFPGTNRYEAGYYRITFENDLAEKLMNISKNNDLSLYILLLTCLKILIFKLTGQCDIIVRSPIHRKISREFNQSVAFRDILHPRANFKELLMEVKQTVIDGYKNEFFPIKNLIQHLGLGENFSLSGIVLLLENLPGHELISDNPDGIYSDITFAFRKVEKKLEGRVIYNATLYKRETIQQLFDYFSRILHQVLNDTDIRLECIQLITEKEKQKLLFDLNDNKKEYPGDMTKHTLFETQAEKRPDGCALVIDKKRITYCHLNEKANQLARLLKKKGVKPDSIVGIMVEPSIEAVIGLLSILKAGGAYLPIDVDYPGDRVRLMLADSHANPLLRQTELPEKNRQIVSVLCRENILIDDESVYSGPGTNLENGKPGNLAYAIYTSGTAGKPKGILCQLRGIVNYTLWRLEFYRYTETDVTLQLLSYCFDGFGSNFYSSLLSGGMLIMVPSSKQLDFNFLIELITHYKVTNISLVPGMYRMLLDTAKKGELAGLRLVVLAGEKSAPGLIKKSREKTPSTLLVNEYGPTETTVTALAHAGIDEKNTAVIGRPIANTRVYILDSDVSPLSPGIPGGLYISGPGVARGYLNNPDLTCEKFIENPYVKEERLYKTGDLGRWLANDSVEFLGRGDQQVKIHGFRIEPGEIERRLLMHKSIKEAVVIAREEGKDNGNKYLTAYIVSQNQSKISILREYLSKYLPDYMIPAYFIQLEEIPLTSNGKIDRKALPDPREINLQGSAQYTAPRNDMEKISAKVWQEILLRDNIGIDDSFFEMGGNSIKAIQVASRLKEFDIEINIDTFFSHLTIRKICSHLQSRLKKPPVVNAPGEPGLKSNITKEDEERILTELNKNAQLSSQLGKNRVIREYGLGPSQKLQVPGNIDADFKSPAMIFFSYDFFDCADPGEIRETIIALAAGNSLLRSIIVKRNSGYYTREFDSFSNIQLPLIDISHFSLDCRESLRNRIRQNLIEPLVILDNVLYRLVVLKSDHNHYEIIFALNHLIFDAASISIMRQKIENIRSGMENTDVEKDYCDYTNFMDNLDYGNIHLEKYLNVFEYTKAVEAVLNNFTVGTMKYDGFEVDISNLSKGLTHLYNEIVFLCYAKFIHKMFNVENVPLQFASFGRNFKGGTFPNIIGDFHDGIPVLFSLNRQLRPEIFLENFLDYREYIRNNNLNFKNYFIKTHIPGLDYSKLDTPFVFNSVLGVYEKAKLVTKDEVRSKSIKERHAGPKKFNFDIAVNDYSNKLWINNLHNSSLDKDKIKEQFVNIYNDQVKDLSQKIV
jgi:amino acid adenylation domain-containing protein